MMEGTNGENSSNSAATTRAGLTLLFALYDAAGEIWIVDQNEISDIKDGLLETSLDFIFYLLVRWFSFSLVGNFAFGRNL